MKQTTSILFSLLLALPALAQSIDFRPFYELAAPPDPRFVIIEEECAWGGTTTGTIGERGWSIATIGAAPTVTRLTSTWPNIGQVRIATTAVATQGGVLSGGSADQQCAELGNRTQTPWSLIWIFKLSSASTAD